MPDIIVMFFLLGVLAGSLKSDLEIPKAAYDILSLLLMLTIGLKGGMALHGNLHWGLFSEILAVMALGFVIPLILYPILRHLVRLNVPDAASFCAHYGSVSAGTFAVALACGSTGAWAPLTPGRKRQAQRCGRKRSPTAVWCYWWVALLSAFFMARIRVKV